MSTVETERCTATDERIGPALVEAMRDIAAYEGGEREGMVREGRVYKRPQRLTRRQKRTRRHSLYRSGASIVIHHEPATPTE